LSTENTQTLIVANRLSLDNGLRMIHCQDSSTAMVALNVLVNAGARDENENLTGIAHLFEHMMFGGSQNIPDYDGEITEAGGENNAWTSNDFTNFYDIAPAHNAETLFHLESDRMLAPSLSQHTLDVQRDVVIEEFKQQCLNRPYGDLMHHLRGMVYGNHPYSWPVIGKTPEHLRKVVRQDMLDWFEHNYTPANSVVAITGNISFERAAELTKKWFGDIPSRNYTPRNLPSIPDLKAPITKTVTGPVPATTITVAYLMDEYGTQDYYAADAITDLLSAGHASRFYRRLIIDDGASVFAEADASITGCEHRGLLMLTARLASEDIDPQIAVDKLIEQAKTVITEGISDIELQRLKNRQQSMFIMSCMDYIGKGQRLAMAEMHNEEPDAQLNAYLKLTADYIVGVADKIFNNTHPAVLIYRPEGKQ
jgi:predicted Zn-dependent peptidase